MMPKEEWGVKRLCPVTNKRFYDLGKNPIVSPYTGEVVILDTGKHTRVQLKAEKASKPVEEDDVVIEDDADVLDDDADVDLDDDVLDDDDDDTVSLEEIADVPSNDDE